MVEFDFDDDLVFNVTLSSESFSGDSQSEIPSWTAWFSSAFLLLMFLIGLSLNGAIVMIFWRRKKLRHLVNFVLLLDCLSHIVLCLICIPIHVYSVLLPHGESEGTSSIVQQLMQQVVGNFANLGSLLLTVSIAILRYRRLCWKKKDKFSTTNAIKWSVTSGSVALGFAVAQSWTCLVAHPLLAAQTFYSIKLALILLSILAIFFCYIRVAQRVWSSGANHEKVMDASKLKKSRSVHMRATFHSCVQIVLVLATLSPYLYMETLDAFKDRIEYNGNSLRLEEKYSTSSQQPTIDRLLSITINYTLLILGTPLAYIASCHRFREQFTSILQVLGQSPDVHDADRRYLNHNHKSSQKSGLPGQTHQHLLHHHHKYHRRSSASAQHHSLHQEQSAESHSHTRSHICPGHKNRKNSIHLQNNNNFHLSHHNFITSPNPHSPSTENQSLVPHQHQHQHPHPSLNLALENERIPTSNSNSKGNVSNYSISGNYSSNRHCSYERNKISRGAISVDSIEYNSKTNFSNSEEIEGDIESSRGSLGFERSIHQNQHHLHNFHHHPNLMSCQGHGCMRPFNLTPGTPVSITSRNICSSSSTASTSSTSSDHHNCDISSNSNSSCNSTSKLTRGFQNNSSGSSFSSHNTTTTSGTGTSAGSPGAIPTSICIPFNSAASLMCQYQHHTTVLIPCSPDPDNPCQQGEECERGRGGDFGQNV